MKVKWTGQAVFSHLTLNCDLHIVITFDLELWPSHTVTAHDGEYLCQVMNELWTGQAVFFHIWHWTVTLTLDLVIQFLLITHCLMMVNICIKLNQIPATNEGVMDWTSCFFTFDLELWPWLCLVTEFLLTIMGYI